MGCRFGKVSPISPDRHRALAFKSCQTVLDVGGVAYFALLAITDDIYARLHLFAHDFGDSAAHAGIEDLGFWCGSGVQGFQSGRQVRGTGQAPGVCGEDTFGAAFHEGVSFEKAFQPSLHVKPALLGSADMPRRRGRSARHTCYSNRQIAGSVR
jgi:hypothetical protein